MIKSFIVTLILFSISCTVKEDAAENHLNFALIERKVINEGDPFAYELLLNENLIYGYDVLKISILAANKYKWPQAYYTIFDELENSSLDIDNLDSATRLYAIYNLQLSADLNYPPALNKLSNCYRIGKYFALDSLKAIELDKKYSYYRKLIIESDSLKPNKDKSEYYLSR